MEMWDRAGDVEWECGTKTWVGDMGWGYRMEMWYWDMGW